MKFVKFNLNLLRNNVLIKIYYIYIEKLLGILEKRTTPTKKVGLDTKSNIVKLYFLRTKFEYYMFIYTHIFTI